jgi:transglutaminase-like putative cysteine protease
LASALATLAHHLAHVQPLHDAWQQLLAFTLALQPEGSELRASEDVFGNVQHHISLAQPHEALLLRASSRVRVGVRFQALQPEAAPPWDALAASLRYAGRAAYQPALQFALPSTYVPRLAELRAYALPHFPPGRPVAAGALALMRALHADFRYETHSTRVDTPLAQAFAQRRGVCQDFAHLLAGMLRMLGLPARYVSGYLLTTPVAAAGAATGADPAPGLLGADASHAWVQVWAPHTPGVPSLEEDASDAWLDLDPTNNLVPGAGHVRVAVGRDFGDVTPLRGVIRGGGQHRLRVGVSTRVLPPEEDTPAAGVLVARDA